MNIPGLEENAIMIDSVSKRYSMCGARIGCIKNKELMAAAMKFAQARLSPPTFAQVASEAALDTPQSYFDEVISEYRERRDTLIAELHKIEGAKVATQKELIVSLNFPLKMLMILQMAFRKLRP
jgi:aspartate aminotransferase